MRLKGQLPELCCHLGAIERLKGDTGESQEPHAETALDRATSFGSCGSPSGVFWSTTLERAQRAVLQLGALAVGSPYPFSELKGNHAPSYHRGLTPPVTQHSVPPCNGVLQGERRADFKEKQSNEA